jgi:hypothetical protein
MKNALMALAWSALLLSCSAALAHSDLRQHTSPDHLDCQGPENIKLGVHIQPWTKDDPSNGSLFKVLSDNVKFAGSRKVTGECVKEIDYAKADIYHFKDSTVLMIDQNEKLVDYPQTLYPDVLDEVDSKQTFPDGKQFIQGIIANGGNILGLWKEKEGFLVTTYKEGNSGPSDKNRLISTALPIRSIRFLPAVDTRGGSIHALIETKDGITLAIFSWSDKQE